MKKLGRIKKLWLLAPFILLLSSCIRVSALQDLAVVQGVGVDYQDGAYKLTLQVFSAEGSGGQTILDPSQQNAKTITCRGRSITDALKETSLSQGRSFFLGHDRLLVLGEGTRELPLPELLALLSGSLELRGDVVVLAALGTAEKLLQAEINQGVLPALTIEQTVENAARSGQIPEIRLLDLNRALASEGGGAVIPAIQAVEEEGEEGSRQLKTVALAGAALYTKDGFCTLLEGETLMGLTLMSGGAERMPLTLSEEGVGPIGVELYQIRSRLEPDPNGRAAFTLCLSVSAMVTERAENPDAETLEKAEALLEKQLAACCQKAFSQTVAENRSDVLGLGERLRRSAPETWARLRESWPEGAEPTLETDISVQINRLRS